MSGAERFRRDPELKSALLTVAQHEQTRECLLLLEAILETPGLMPRLTEVLRKQGPRDQGTRDQGSGNKESEDQGLRDRQGLGQGTEAFGGTAMNWETFYLVCFLAGLMLSFVSLLGGMGHFGGHVHVPHVHVPHAGHVPHMPHGAVGAFTRASGGGSAARVRARGAVVERILDHDFSLLVWRGGISVDEVWKLCRRRGGGAGGDLRTWREERSSLCF